ncbi:MAG TPA: hypothetical protein PKK60_00980 [archaeon]|nr:hypothetical protein [archaeon]
MSKDIFQQNKSNVLYLTNVTYIESKREVLVEFSNKFEKKIERYKFFPFILLPKSIDGEKLKELLISFSFRSFSLQEKENYFSLQSVSFLELKKMVSVLSKCFGKLPLVLEPERQFLIEKNWSYFDSFSYFENSLIKVDSFLKDVSFSVLPEIPFVEALKINQEEAVFFVNQAVLSNILKVPINLVPKNKQEQEEIFLENIFFKNAEFVSWEKENFVKAKNFTPFGYFDNFSSIDFSPVWVELFSKKFFNIGPETKNCSCCKPFTLEDKNLLPSSLIEVKFVESDFFFESSSENFAQEFHIVNENKLLREQKKKEFFLKHPPIGPFSVGQVEKVPLLDAKKLLLEGVVELSTEHKVDWFCLNKESFFSKELYSFSEKLNGFEEFSKNKQTSLLISSFEDFFAEYFIKNFSNLVAEIPFQLMNKGSKFYSVSLAKTIISIQEATLFKFKEFSEKEGYRILHTNSRGAYVKGYSSLTLAKKFSSSLALPLPKIRSFAKNSKLS